MGYFLQLNWETLWQKGFIYFASVCYCTTVAGKEIVTNKICSKLSKISLWSCCSWLWQLLIIDFKIEMSTHLSNYFVLMSITLRSENDTTDVAKCWQKTKRDILFFQIENYLKRHTKDITLFHKCLKNFHVPLYVSPPKGKNLEKME